MALDAAMLVLACASAVVALDRAGIPMPSPPVLALYPLLTILALSVCGAYRPRLRIHMLDGLTPLAGGISVAAMSATAVLVVTGAHHASQLMARAWIFSLLYVIGARVLLTLAERRARRRGAAARPALIVGAGAIGAHVARRLREQPEYGLRPVGFLDPDADSGRTEDGPGTPVLGHPRDLERTTRATGARHVILAFTSDPDRSLVPLVRRSEALGLHVWLVPRLFESMNERATLDHLGGLPMLSLQPADPTGFKFAIKHGLDRAASFLALVAAAPLLLGIALAVRISSPGPVLFRQRRVGRDGTVFDLFKFRTMRMPDETGRFVPSNGRAPGGVEGPDRRTRIGRWLRRASLDELPQLINVLRGEMSLVGPRPERPEFVEVFGRDIAGYDDRHRVKSGITGWAQVHGLRGQTSVADRVEWDNYYIENWSLRLDLKIIVLTAAAMLRAPE